jgi:hypothetical protein
MSQPFADFLGFTKTLIVCPEEKVENKGVRRERRTPFQYN